MRDFLKKVGVMLCILLLIMAAVFAIIAGFQYNFIFGVAGILLTIAAVPTGIKLVKYLLDK